MGILDELRNKANEKKDAQQVQMSREQMLADNYKQLLLPKMQMAFKTFNEVVSNLNFLDEPLRVESYCRRYPQLGVLRQQEYRINTDGFGGLVDHNRIMQINLTYFLKGDGTFSYAIEGQRVIEQEVSFLHSRSVLFEWKHVAGRPGFKTAAFVVQRKIPVRFRLEVLYETSELQFSIDNHEDLSHFSKKIEPSALNEEFLDNVVGYLLRRNHEFTRLDISDQHKQQIRSKLDTMERERAALLEQIRREEAASKNQKK